MEPVSIDQFPHITLDYYSEPCTGILRRQLTAKLIHCSLGDLPYNASFLPRLLLWSVDIWLLYSHLLLSLDLPELTCGIKNFLQCPLESKDPGVIVDWICSLWNFHLAPLIESMLQSDPRLSIMSPQFNGTVKSNQKEEQHRYKALMQLLLACTRLVFLPTCPLQLEMKVKMMEQLTSRLEGLLNVDVGKESSEKGNMVDSQSNGKWKMHEFWILGCRISVVACLTSYELFSHSLSLSLSPYTSWFWDSTPASSHNKQEHPSHSWQVPGSSRIWLRPTKATSILFLLRCYES